MSIDLTSSMLRLSGCVKGIQSTDISMEWCTIACAIDRCLHSWFSFGLCRVGDQSWCVSWSVPPGACMPYRLLQPSEEYLAGCSNCPVSWYGTKHLKYTNIEGHWSDGNLVSYQERACFKVECTQQRVSPFSAPCALSLGPSAALASVWCHCWRASLCLSSAS